MSLVADPRPDADSRPSRPLKKAGLMGNGMGHGKLLRFFPISHCPFAIQDAFFSILREPRRD
jgi:hypothetical protein